MKCICRSFGVVLWEMMTEVIPFAKLDPSAVIYGVGTNSLRLPIPKTMPGAIGIIITLCLSLKPHARPSFETILQHLKLASAELENMTVAQLCAFQAEWKVEIEQDLERQTKACAQPGKNGLVGESLAIEKRLIDKRRIELRHATVCC